MNPNWASLGFLLIFVGFAVILVAIMLGFLWGGRVKGGGIILVGPFPLIFGSDAKTVKTLIVLTLLLIAFTLLVMFLPLVAAWR